MMTKRVLHIILLCFTVLLLSSCRIQRHVPEGKHFLHENKVVIKGKKVEFKKSDITPYITQKTHKVSFPTRFPTWLYYVTENKTNSKFWNWVNKYLSRHPEYYDRDAAYHSAKQIEQYLDNRGYFHSKVTNTVKYKNHKAYATYTIEPSTPYRISKINYQIEDTALIRSVMRLEDRFPAKVNDIYNAYTLDEQRIMITDFLRNMGYYYFSREYVTFEVDSSYNNHTLEITMKIANVMDRETNTYQPHKRFTINKINIYPNYMPVLANIPPSDSATITYSTGTRNIPNTLHLYYHEKPCVRPSTFTEVIQIFEGRPYRQRQVEMTYSALSSLKMFSNSSIEFENVSHDSLNLLNCNILLRRSDSHSIKLQTEATNSGGDLGISGSVTYTNKNTFKGAEVLTVSVKGGLEAQEIIDLGGVDDESSVFNTGELIFNSSLSIPKFLSPIPFKTFALDYQPKTTVSFGSSAQVRYAYSRYMTMGSFGYDWKSNPRLQFIVTPFYLNYVKVNPIPEFQAILDQEQNQRIKDQYTSHFVLGGRYSVIYNTQSYNKNSNYIYIRGNLESSGGLVSLFNGTRLINEQDDHHELFGIRYAQFLRADIDFRQYYNLGEKTWFVCRQLLGFGLPYGNSYDMPFERSFYSGGSMGMRGWDYRKLGPGAYVPTSEYSNIERIGDIQLELNAELRFPIRGSFNGAIFVDAGNIWNYHANELLPNGEFHFNSFYNQLAMDAGIGVRMDLKMVIIRLDMAVPMRYPYLDDFGSHWHFNDMSLDDLNFVLNIGYPF